MKTTIKQFSKAAFAIGMTLLITSCDKNDENNDNNSTDPLIEGNETYVLGVGITDAENNSTNYVVHTSSLTSGKVSLINNGILQDSYRSYINIGNYFYAIGGLGLTDVNAYYINSDSRLTAKKGLVFPNGASDYRDVDNGKTLLAVEVATDASYEGNVEFLTVDVAGYAIKNTTKVPAKEVYNPKSNDHGWSHSGIAISGNKAFQAVFPISKDWATPNVDTNYIAVYSYPAFELQKVIKDTRTGPSGAPLMRSGIFATESGDVYTVSHDGYGYDHNKDLKDAAILKIAAGTDEFDPSYYFKTTGIANGGRIFKAVYIGDNKLLAHIKAGEQVTNPTTGKPSQWDQTALTCVIVDLAGKKITPIANAPTYDGAEDIFVQGNKAYFPAKSGNALNIYEIDLSTSTAQKGLEVEATYVLGIGKLTK